MKWFWQTKATLTLNQLIERIEALSKTVSGVSVTPANCMRSPTVQAIVQAVARRISISPPRVLRRVMIDGQTTREALPKHPAAVLLRKPNEWQTTSQFWLDATSTLIRYGNFYAVKVRGSTGPTRALIPLDAGNTTVKVNDANAIEYRGQMHGGQMKTYTAKDILHCRGAARNFIVGDSPVLDIKDAIALEIAAESFGATFFANGAVPLMVFQLQAGFKDFKTDEERDKFLESVRETLGGNKTHRAFLLPKGIDLADKNKVSIDHDKAQMIESRKHQRTVIAGAFGVPPHLVGDLERATFNNVEQQDTDFTINVVMPYVKMIEEALERDLLTPSDRSGGVIIRFNLDSVQRADFKSRQEGLQIQRLNGIISADEWRELDYRNPLPDDQDGREYWRPSNYVLATGPTAAPVVDDNQGGSDD